MDSDKFSQMSLAVLRCGVGIAALTTFSSVAEAQDNSSIDESASIIVTGSRLVTNGMQAPVPITAVTTEELEALAPDTLITGLSQLPQFYGNETPGNGNFFNRGGYGTLNLRGLGINRTLTLLNGRRMPSSSAFGGADINLFPEAMISGVETVTGGASAAYGSDAVAGVVNFKINTDYTGLEGEAQYGISERGDGENYEFSAAWGTDIGDRGHFQISAEYFDQKGIFTYDDRDWYRNWGTIVESGMVTFHPDVVSMNATFDGIISSPSAAINGLVFDANGNYAPFVKGSAFSGSPGATGARTSITNGGSGDDLACGDVCTVSPDLERYSIFAYGDYELADGLKAYAQYMRGYTRVWQWNTNRGVFHTSPATIFQDNAFLPADLNQLMKDNNIQSFLLRRAGHSDDVGAQWLEDRSTQDIATAGMTWDIDANSGFMDGWRVDAFYQYGRTFRDWRQYGTRMDRFFAAMDAVDEGQFKTGIANGNIVCRVSLFAAGAAAFPGCQPLNLFGRGNASAAAINYVLGNDVGLQINTPLYFAGEGFAANLTDSYTSLAPKQNLTTFTQHQAEISVAGDLLQGWAGPISLAFGANWRRESIFQIVRDTGNPSSNHDTGHPVLCNGEVAGLRGVQARDCANTVAFQFSKVPNMRGASEVKEAFLETLVPLADTDAFTTALSGAVRWADYSGSGPVWAYKGGLELGFADQVRLRGTYSRDVRAANLAERFNQTGGFLTLVNPFNNVPSDDTLIVTGGNPTVAPEKADTYTLGAVFTPEFIPGLSLSVDWYKVTLNGAISTVGTQRVVDNCFAGAQEFCDLITFGPNDDLEIVRDIYVNIAKSVVSGIDAELAYRTPVNLLGGGDESISFRAFASWLRERSEITSNGVYTDYAGQTGASQGGTATYYQFPDFKLTGSLTYRNRGFSALLQGRYIGEGIQDVTLAEGLTIADNSVDAIAYFDLRLAYEFPLGGAMLEVFGNVTNLFDADPPLAPSMATNALLLSQTNSALYDVLGRRFTVGAKFKL